MDITTILMLGVLAVLVFFMFRNGRKRKKDQETLQSTMVPGAEVMTNFGLYGTIVAIDDVENKVSLEIAPGTVVTIHRQTIARVVEPTVAEPVDAPVAELNQDHATVMGEPEFGQRVAGEEIHEDTDEPKKGDA